MLVNAMASLMHLRNTWDRPFAHYTAAALRKRQPLQQPTPDVSSQLARQRITLGMRMAYYYAATYTRVFMDKLESHVGGSLARAQHASFSATTLRAPAAGGGGGGGAAAPLVFDDNATIDLIQLQPCNASEQGICTNCLLFDESVRLAQIGGNGLRDFYTDNETGYLALVDRFVEGINNSLLNPQGNDTFTTPDKRVPWIGNRLTTVRWFWQWNYTQFLNIVRPPSNGTTGGGGGGAGGEESNATELLLEQRSQDAGRDDLDLFFVRQFRSVVAPLLRIGESLIGSSSSAAAGGSDVLSELFITYLQCDYQGALQCQSANLGIGLFDGLMNTALIYVVIGTVLVSINVMFGFSLFVLLLPFAYTILMWISYGASPLCTGPSIVFGIPGVPTCLPADLYTLASETLQQCPVLPISLIDPADLAAASSTLCTSCTGIPRLQNCQSIGFIDGLDVFFYSAPSIFGDSFNEQAASALAAIAPDVAVVAQKYTPEYIASLGDKGADCNRILLPTLLTGVGLVSARLSTLARDSVSVIVLAAAALWLLWITVLWLIEVARQIDEGFVQQTRVEKLKLKEN